jgi:amidohydrolase
MLRPLAQSLVLIVAVSVTLLGTRIASAEDPLSWVEKEWDSLSRLYLHLHRNPELSMQEKETSARIASELRSAGFEVTHPVGKYGVVGVLKNGDGPTVLVRCDMDGLPVTEQTEVEYASKAVATNTDGTQTGVMHACGHDIHMTSVVGAARYLASHRNLWKGTLIVIGQPAEEIGAGAKAMLEDGLLTRFPKPDVAVALHVRPDIPTGSVGICAGPAMANVDSVNITMHGRGGHGSAPKGTMDPIVQAAELVVSLQTIVSREISPTEPAVVTVGAIHGGTKHNIIPNSCELKLTVRSYTDEMRKHLLDAIARKARAVAKGANAPEPTIEVSEGTPALYNDVELTARISKLLGQTLGEDKVVTVPPSMGGEDFSRYGREGIPICMYRLGTITQARLDRYKAAGVPSPALHSSKYLPDFEEALPVGIQTMSIIVMDLMKP